MDKTLQKISFLNISKLGRLILTGCLFHFGLNAHAAVIKSPPKNIALAYDLKRDGQLFAKVKETFSQTGSQYTIISITKGEGVYALMGERKLTSSGDVTKNGLKPKHFELHQSNSSKKTLINDFDWVNNTLAMQVKGKVKTERLVEGTQDLISYAYQFMFVSPTTARVGKNNINVHLTTGKKLNQYAYKVQSRGHEINAAGKQFKTLHIANSPLINEEKKQLWLAEDHYYLPVQYQLTDENGANFEQTLTSINVD